MPALNLLEPKTGYLRWDASSLLISTTMVPDDASLRRQYAATLRIETASGLPEDTTRLSKQDHVLAAKFKGIPRINQKLQTRRIHAILAGAMLWDLRTAAI